MSNTKTVWSSEHGDLRKQKDLTPGPSTHAGTRPARNSTGVLREGGSLPPQQQTAYLHRDSSGRGGKPVSLVKNLVLSDEDMKTLTKKLKQECGTGGTIKNGVIEIQGEQRQRIAEILLKLGYKVKIAGG
jgi:predicted translation initiation factor SUI1